MAEHKFPYRWYLKDGYPAKGIERHGKKVFGTFICGGGSTMGYKLAGYDHLGGVEFDKKVAEVYRVNHHPKYLFVEDIREFNKRTDLPKEFFELDLLDGSPPCSSFSTAGNRDKDWGKQKQFREGQAFQRLDDLVFEYIDTIKLLQPKVALLENVKGLIIGNAKAYAKNMKAAFEAAGYRVQVFLLNAASMGVPQKRERVFFVGLRKDLKVPELRLQFSEKPIPFGRIRIIGIRDTNFTDHDTEIWSKRKRGDESYSDIFIREQGRENAWNSKFIYDEKILNTIASSSGSKLVLFEEPRRLCDDELKLGGTFPMDYDFHDLEVKYLVGMSVPPVMTAQISHQIYLQWLSKF